MAKRKRASSSSWIDKNPDFKDMLKITIGLLIGVIIALLYISLFAG